MKDLKKDAIAVGFIVVVTSLIAGKLFHVLSHDISLPMHYDGLDSVWQLVLTKVLTQTGWVLTNPYLGAPSIAHWHLNSAAQTSALHSVIMLALSPIFKDPVKLQTAYYLINFPLIATTTYVASRMLNISRSPAAFVGIIFAFTTFRLSGMIYSFLPNYFMLPLAVAVVIWISAGAFTRHGALSGKAIASYAIIALLASSDGYYAFFILLLLGFSIAFRLLNGDLKQPSSLVAPTAMVAIVLGVSLSLMIPLKSYERSHVNEFYVNGVVDPAVAKRPAEAEIYAPSLKMLFTPNHNHRIPFLAHVERYMKSTSDGFRAYPLFNWSPLGLFGSFLLLSAAILLCIPRYQLFFGVTERYGQALLPLILFSLLCTLTGGVGAMAAMIFPAIRAYDRFGIILLLLLYILFAHIWSIKNRTDLVSSAVLAVLCAVVLVDQIPILDTGSPALDKRFLAERRFVQRVESELPAGAEVYQYPHSNYLEDNKYYGWGSFAPVRLYLHSKSVRWSNGASKNSLVELWHNRIAELPFPKLWAEVQAAGFAEIVIDRTVVPQKEYDAIAAYLNSIGVALTNDDESGLASAKIPQGAVTLKFQADPFAVSGVTVNSPKEIDYGSLPLSIKSDGLEKLVASNNKFPLSITVADHPEVFRTQDEIDIASGNHIFDQLNGEMSCALVDNEIRINLKNEGKIDWVFGQGQRPLFIGLHLLSADGKTVNWDAGGRYPKEPATIHPNEEANLSVPLPAGTSAIVQPQVLQEGHMWFNNMACSVARQ